MGNQMSLGPDLSLMSDLHSGPCEARTGLVWSALLPYTHTHTHAHEAHTHFEEIKRGIAESIAKRQLAYPFKFWCRKLTEYLKVHGFAFSMSDHVAVIHALWSIISTPNMPESTLSTAASTLHTLLKKRSVLPSDAVVLPWRVLYDLIKTIAFPKLRCPQQYSKSLILNLVSLVDSARRFFPPSATAELLDEVRPLLCPHDMSLYTGVTLFTIFVPTDGTSPAASAPEFLSWVDEMMDVWTWVEGGQEWDLMWIGLLARTARRNYGTSIFNNYLDFIFTKMLRWFGVPVGSGGSYAPPKHPLPQACSLLLGNNVKTPYHLSFFTALALSPESPSKGHLERLIQAVQSFCHPSNTGAWSPKIGLYVYYIVEAVTHRLQEEAKPDCGVPVHLRLTLEDRKWLVTTLRPVVFLGQFSKSPAMVGAATWALKGLAYLSPNDIIPQYLESAYPALQTLTETHQTVSALTGLAAIARPLFSKEHYPEGAAHLMPLLHLSLPGIDMNDFIKSHASLQFFMSVFNTIPLVDCSYASAPSTATERDLEVYASTSSLEEWVTGFLDRVFEVMKTQVAVSKKSSLESFINTALNRGVTDLFQQLSPALFEVALDKVFRFVTSHILLSTAKSVGFICAAATYANPEASLKKFLPFVVARIISIANSHPTVDEPEADENEVTEELLWYLHIAARLVRRCGSAILAYRDLVVDLLNATLPLAAKKASKLAGKVLRQILKGITEIYPLDRRSVTPSVWSRVSEDPISVFDTRGSSPGVSAATEIRWHIPTKEEYEFSEELVRTFFDPAHEHLKGILARDGDVSGPSKMEVDAAHEQASAAPSQRKTASDVVGNKNRLRMSLMIVRNVVRCGQLVLPESTAEPIPRKAPVAMAPSMFVESMNDFPVTKEAEVRRDAICATMEQLSTRLLKYIEDDTKTFSLVIKIITELLLIRGNRPSKFPKFMEFYRRMKQTLENVVKGNKDHTRTMIVERAYFQHLRRKVHNMSILPYNERHKGLIDALVVLSTSRYAIVRRRAQSTLSNTLVLHTRAKSDVFNYAVELLRPERKAEHHQIKGALYVLCQKSMWRFFIRHLEALKQFVVYAAALHSNEKMSIQKVVSSAFKYITRLIRQIEQEAKATEENFDKAVALLPELEALRGDFAGQFQKQSRNADRKQGEKAQDVISTLLGILTQSSSHWRYELMMATMLSRFFRVRNFQVPENVVRYFATNMANDAPPMRALSFNTCNLILAIQKAVQPKQWLTTLPGGPSPLALSPTPVVVRPPLTDIKQGGPRADNLAACFHISPAERPQSAVEYDNSIFFDKNCFGWAGFPRQIRVCVPFTVSRLQVPDTGHSAILAVLQEEGWLANMLELVSQERSDGTTSGFNEIRAEVYKGIFRNFGLPALETFKPHVEKLCVDVDKAARQRSAAEIIAGLVRGMKHWSFDETQVAWSWLIPLMQKTLSQITNDAVPIWAAGVRFCVYDRDPRRIYPLYDFLFTIPSLVPETVSAVAQHRSLHFLSSALEELSWRGAEPSLRLLQDLEPFLSHPYKLVRERIARSLYSIFRNFWSPTASGETGRDVTGQFVDRMLRLFESQREAALASGAEEDKQTVARLGKTMLQLVVYLFSDNCGQCIVHKLAALLPVLFTVPEVGSEDPELLAVCSQGLGLISQYQIPREFKDGVFSALLQSTAHPSWHVRRRSLLFLQVAVFRNFFTAPTEKVMSTLIGLLQDEQLEIRELAAVTLSGLIRCGMCNEDALRSEFYAAAKTPVRKSKRRRSSSSESLQPLTPEEKAAIVKRHSGILGLNAFLLAHPYSIPSWMPELLVFLADRTNDPEPIRTTVKKAMSEFWRTHQDTWRTSKHLFTEDQVITITDLLISPSYYA